MGWTFPVLLLILLLVSLGLGKALTPLLRNRIFKVVFVPGLIAAMLLRLLGCYITGAEPKRSGILSREPVALSYDLQEATPLGKLIVATLPFLAMLTLFGITLSDQSYWSPQVKVSDQPVENSFSEELAQLGQILNDSCTDVTNSVSSWVRDHTVKGDLSRLIGFYFTIALLVYLPPQRKESRYAVAGMAIVGLLAWFLLHIASKLKIGVEALQEQKILLMLSRLVAVLAFALVISVVCVRLPLYIHRLASGGKQEVRAQK